MDDEVKGMIWRRRRGFSETLNKKIRIEKAKI